MCPADTSDRPRRLDPIAIEVVLVAEDLLAGDARDDQLKRLAAFARKHGGTLGRATVVRHEQQEIVAALSECERRAPDLVIVAGGLGPARRDVTLDAVAELFERPLTAGDLSRQWIEESYGRLARKGVLDSGGMTVVRERLARIPVGSQPLRNQVGLANGIWLRIVGRPAVLCLPGMPRESESMLDDVDDAMRELRPRPHVVRREIESPTADEAALQPTVERLSTEFPGLRIQTRPGASARKGAQARVILECHAPTESEANGRIGDAIRRLIALQSGS